MNSDNTGGAPENTTGGLSQRALIRITALAVAVIIVLAVLAGILAHGDKAPPHIPGGRSLVWSDEFNDRSSIENNWVFRTQMSSPDVQLATDERHADVKDGKLVLNTYRLDNGGEKDFSIPMAITTYDRMVFKYGYLEMRARIPYRHGAWPSFWMISYDKLRKASVQSEIDIFEVFSSENRLASNIHKWGGGAHVQLGSGGLSEQYMFRDFENLNEEYHTYGFEWNETEMSFYVDGDKYRTVGITEADEYAPGLSGMDCYQDYHYIILCDYIFTPKNSWKPAGAVVTEMDEFPYTYYVDWIRLYQGRGEEMVTG